MCAEAYFGEGAKHRHYHKVSHTASGRRRKVASAEGDGFWDDFKSGFKSVFDPIGKPLLGLLPGGGLVKSGLEAVGLGRPHRRSLHSRLSHHELGFQGLADGGDTYDLDYFGSGVPSRSGGGVPSRSGGGVPSRSGGGKRALKLSSHPAVVGAEGDALYHHYAMGDAHSGGSRKHHHRGHADADGHHLHHRGHADADGGRRKHRKPSARNLIVKKVMMERGLSLPQASKYVKDHHLY